MEYMEYRAYCQRQKEHEVTLCKFWVDGNGEVDRDNLPSPGDISALLQALRLYEVHVEFTGRVEDEE